MKLEIISYQELIQQDHVTAHQKLAQALLTNGIVGVSDVPGFIEKSRAYVAAAQAFGQLAEATKKRYMPNRDAGDYEGYELGAEWFKDANGEWQTDDKKASYYAVVPDDDRNIWPTEVDLRTPYLALGNLIFATGKRMLSIIGLDERAGIHDNTTIGHGRMLHYQSVRTAAETESAWCGAHYDHCVLTGLMPAYYFRDGIEIAEPMEAGLYVVPHHQDNLEKVTVPDHNVMLFQAGEFGQIISNDRIHATRHLVKKAPTGVERFSFALFLNMEDSFQTHSTSVLVNDARYQHKKQADGSITYGDWSVASYDRYRVL